MRYTFAGCYLDTASFAFFRGGTQQPIEPQVFDLLRVLAENAGQLVSRDRLIETVWDGRIVSDATVAARINAARAAVGDDGKAQRVIRTIPRRGIELIVPVDVEEPQESATGAVSETRQTIRYATAPDGAMLAYAASGEGPPLFYAAHHVTHLELEWQSPLRRPFFDRLGAAHRLIRYDMRGTGLSAEATVDDTMDMHLADFIAVADAAGLDRFPVLANLNSAQVAVRFAAERPDRVSRLIVQNGYARGRALRGAKPMPPEADPFMQLLLAGGWGDPENGFMRAWMSMALPGLDSTDLSAVIRLVGDVTSIENAIASRRVIDHFDCREWLGQVQAPTLVIHARSGALHPLEEGRIVAAGIPGAEFLVVDSGNTLCLTPDPTFDQQLEAILEFLA